MEKNPLLLEVQLFGYHYCNELYVVHNVQQKLGLIAMLKKKLLQPDLQLLCVSQS